VAKEKIDIITLELINNFLYSVVDEMTIGVVRTSFSPLTRDAFDFQCGLCHASGEMLLEGEGTLSHSMVYPTLISNWMREHADTTYPDDIIFTNDPYLEAAHLPDPYIWHPIFIDGKIVAWSVAGGHLRDVGGRTPGSCACDSTEIYQEGLRIPPMKLYERGVPNKTLFDIFKANSRLPDVIVGDIEAYHSACHIGEERFLQLAKTYSWETLSIYLDELLDHTERLTRDEIRRMPDGVYEFTDYMDDDGITDEPIKLHLKITVAGDEITYDFTGTSPQVKGALNNPYGSSKAMVITGLRDMMSPDIPRNSGAWRPITLIIPEGNFLNPSLPAAVASRGGTQARQNDVMLGAEAQIRPDKIPACCSNGDHLLNIGGRDKDGKPFILVETVWGGWGGRPNSDGVDYNTPPWQNGSNQSAEANEELLPITYNQYGYLPDREGAGQHRGSVAIVREWKFTGDEAVLQLRTDRQDYETWGLHGGKGGTPSESIINPDTENHHIGKTTMRIKKGDVYRIITAGAGGWGDPLERDPKLVLKDVRDEKVSAKRAREAYGVVINEATVEVDIAETEKLRGKMKGEENGCNKTNCRAKSCTKPQGISPHGEARRITYR